MAIPGGVIWITGLSGSGKTTLAEALLPMLPEPRVLLDGDGMREALSPIASGYSIAERHRLAFTYSRLCGMLARQGLLVVCATISMFHDVREWNRQNLTGYLEVYLEASAAVRISRDYKGVYSSGKAGESPVMGIHIDPELPRDPDLVLRQCGQLPKDMARQVAGMVPGATPA